MAVFWVKIVIIPSIFRRKNILNKIIDFRLGNTVPFVRTLTICSINFAQQPIKECSISNFFVKSSLYF
jgi:hypothetical protein